LDSQPLISIVDDDQPCRDSLRRLLRSLGYRVNAFSSARDFLASISVRETGCLIADIQMPAMTGLELYQQLNTQGLRIPTILVTAFPTEDDRARSLGDGVLGYLRKPIDEQELARYLDLALKPQ
jgi:FixJ family two-component response regulator